MGRPLTDRAMAQQMPAGIPAGAQMPKTQEEAAAMQEKQSEMEDKRKMILNQVLTAEAQDRLGRIAVVKASYARQVEDTLIQQAMQGKLPGQIDDKALLGILEKFGEDGAGPKVKIQRRDIMDDDGW